jgi:hypothetical protein
MLIGNGPGGTGPGSGGRPRRRSGGSDGQTAGQDGLWQTGLRRAPLRWTAARLGGALLRWAPLRFLPLRWGPLRWGRCAGAAALGTGEGGRGARGAPAPLRRRCIPRLAVEGRHLWMRDDTIACGARVDGEHRAGVGAGERRLTCGTARASFRGAGGARGHGAGGKGNEAGNEEQGA